MRSSPETCVQLLEETEPGSTWGSFTTVGPICRALWIELHFSPPVYNMSFLHQQVFKKIIINHQICAQAYSTRNEPYSPLSRGLLSKRGGIHVDKQGGRWHKCTSVAMCPAKRGQDAGQRTWEQLPGGAGMSCSL